MKMLIVMLCLMAVGIILYSVYDKLYDNKNNQVIKEENISSSTEKVKLDSVYYGKTQDQRFDIELDLSKAIDYIFEYTDADYADGEIYEKIVNRIIQEKVNILENLIEENASFVVVVLNTKNACSSVEEDVFEMGSSSVSILEELNIYCYTINLPVFKKTSFYKNVKYAPAIIVFNNGEISAYTDANVDSFDNKEQIKNWLTEHIEM